MGGMEVVGRSGVVLNEGDPKGAGACPPGGDPQSGDGACSPGEVTHGGGGACPLGGDAHGIGQ
jgi:hypothetical protein